MALSYEQSSTLMQDGVFIGRVKIGCLKFADYISGEPNNVPAHPTRVKWAQNTFANPQSVAQSITPTVVMDPAVQDMGSAIDDAGLQSAVENAVNKVL